MPELRRLARYRARAVARKPGGARRGAVGFSVADVRLGTITPYLRNPRQNAGAVAKVAASIKAFGFRQPIVCDEQMIIIAGHTRFLAAQSLGLNAVPVHIARGLTPAQVRAYRLADNRTAQEATWDNDSLVEELLALKADDFDLPLTGFDPAELDALLNPPGESEPEGGHLGDVDYQIIVSCADEHAQAKLCEELEGRGLRCRPLML